MKYKRRESYIFHFVDGVWMSPEGTLLQEVCHAPILHKLAATDYTAQFHIEDNTFKYSFVNGRDFVRVYMFWK